MDARRDVLDSCGIWLNALEEGDGEGEGEGEEEWDAEDEESPGLEEGDTEEEVKNDIETTTELASLSGVVVTAVAVVTVANAIDATNEEQVPPLPSKQKKGNRSVLFGAIMGLAVACWVFSGNYIFTAIFTSLTLLGQLEYYRMVMRSGIYPARRISVVGACSMFVTVSSLQ